MIPLFGFTLLRNGIKYDYPFQESLQSLSELCKLVYVALGKSEDGTEAALGHFSNLRILPTVWDENLRKSGLILSVQTNIALEGLRKEQPEGWGIYLQADEIFNPSDFPQLRADIEAADRSGCDGISFRYLHFWQRYDHLATSPRWYPQEIRAIRLDSQAVSYGDAQSLAPLRKVFFSDVPVHHYGHVRKQDAYERKRWDFGRWWHNDDELAKVLKKGEKREQQEKTVAYYGPHPRYMEAKIASQSPLPGPRKITVYGRKENFTPEFLGRIQADMHWTLDAREIQQRHPESVVLLEPLPLLRQLFSFGKFRSNVPTQMGSELARPWTKEFIAILRFSEKNISVR